MNSPINASKQLFYSVTARLLIVTALTALSCIAATLVAMPHAKPVTAATPPPSAADTAGASVPFQPTVAHDIIATVVHTIATSLYSSPIPDPTGITYLPSRRSFLVSDSEVDELFGLTGAQIFEVNLAGELVNAWSTVAYSSEPTEVEAAPDFGRLYLIDDNLEKLFVLSPGADGQFGTPDDSRTSLDTGVLGSLDPEGLAFDSEQGHLYLVDGTRQTLIELIPGENQVFDGVAPQGDDRFVTYELSGIGLRNLRGLFYNPANDHLYVTGLPATEIAEITRTGRVVQSIFVTATMAIEPSDLVFAPAAADPDLTHLYLVDRGRDTISDTAENDGRIFELSLPSTPAPHQQPTVTAGADQTIHLQDSPVQLSGTVEVDPVVGMGDVAIQWHLLSGPAQVDIAAQNAAGATATFRVQGTYTLRLLVDDGYFAVGDTLTITVLPVHQYLPSLRK